MWKVFGIKCVNWSTFCILDEYPRAGVDALKEIISSVAWENSGKTTAFHVDHGSPSRRLLHSLINKNYQTDHIPQKFLKTLLDVVVYLLLFLICISLYRMLVFLC